MSQIKNPGTIDAIISNHADLVSNQAVLSGVTPYAATVTPIVGPKRTVMSVDVLTGNITIAAPVAADLNYPPADGAELVIRFIQDATGSRSFTWNAAFVFGTSPASSAFITTANGKSDGLFQYDAVSAKWRCVRVNSGF